MRSFLIFLFTACSFALYGEARAAESLVAFDETQVTPKQFPPIPPKGLRGNLNRVMPVTSREFPPIPPRRIRRHPTPSTTTTSGISPIIRGIWGVLYSAMSVAYTLTLATEMLGTIET